MKTTTRYYAVIAILLLAVSPSHAGPCAQAIARVQSQVDAAIENRAGSKGWRPEGLDALRGYQPTPESLAATEGIVGEQFQVALDSLDRARAADRSGYAEVCYREVENARSAAAQ